MILLYPTSFHLTKPTTTYIQSLYQQIIKIFLIILTKKHQWKFVFSHFCCYSQNYHLAFCKNPSRSLARLYDDLIVFKAIIALNPVKVHFYSEFGGINSSINHHAQNNFNSNVIAIITTFSKIPWKYRQTGGRRYDGIRKEGTIQTFVLWFEIFLVWILS